MNATLFRKRVFADVTNLRFLKWRDHSGVLRIGGGVPKSNDKYLQKRDTGEMRRREDRGRDQRDVATSQGKPRITNSRHKLVILPQSFWRECRPANILILDSGLQNCERINYCCFLTYPPPQKNDFLVYIFMYSRICISYLFHFQYNFFCSMYFCVLVIC